MSGSRFETLLQQISREAGKGGMDIDVQVYRAAGRDPLWPVLLGSGALSSRLGIFGRDPGRTEAELGEPFIGKGGQLVRTELYRRAGGKGTPSLEQSILAGRSVFWGNTVPFKPVGNKAWSVAVKRRFAPYIAAVLTECWTGTSLITLGNEAFFWFGLAEPANKPALATFWQRPGRYRESISVTLAGKPITLYPLPHPSPLNATWYSRFPEMLAGRLDELGWQGG